MISVGQTVGNYRVTAKLGEGGMGVVFLAEHPVIGRKVALKAIHPELSRNPEVISRFMTEAKSVNQIGNEHIVDISDFGNTAEGEFYFVMEFLQGESLADRMKREHLIEIPRALKIAAQVADALAGSHDHGIIHRDLKPENIYLIPRGSNPDFVKVLDFGLAKLTQGDEKVSHKTRTGSVMGTPYYMSPEQCEGKANVDHRADIYSLGVILFEMLTGKVPFGGEGYGEIIVKHITQAPPSPHAINPQVQASHEALIFRALAKDREERFQHMVDFRAGILDPEAYLSNAPPLAAGQEHGDPDKGRGTNAMSRAGGLGAEPRSIPTTFRHGAGEIGDEFDQIPQRSKKGLVIGVVGGLVVAGLAAVLLLGGNKPEAPPVAAVEPATPTQPESVPVSFRSMPPGATVTIKSTGEVLGVTPFEKTLPFGQDVVEVSFALAGYKAKTDTFVPNQASKLSASLDNVDIEPTPVAVADPVKKPDRQVDKPSRPVVDKTKPGKTKPVKGKRPAVLDEDAVLEPSFD